MLKSLSILVLLLSIFGCGRNTEIRQINKQTNEWSYQDKFTIILPQGHSFSSSIIMKNDSIKVGEVALANELLLKSITGKEYLELNKARDEFSTKETNYSMECEGCELIKSDSIETNHRKWYFDITRSEFEGPEEYGAWNAFTFANIEDKRITIITFYNRELNDLRIQNYKAILKTVKFFD